MTIYDIVDDTRAILSLVESLTDEETGETRELTDEEKATFVAWIDENKAAFDAKFDSICKVYRNMQATAKVCLAEKDAMQSEMDRLTKRAKARENEAKRIKELIWFAFDKLGKNKHKTDLFSANFQATAASVKTDSSFTPDTLPDELLKPRELAASKIKEGLDKGELYQLPVGENPVEGVSVSPLDEGAVFIKATKTKISGLRYLKGKTLMIR